MTRGSESRVPSRARWTTWPETANSRRRRQRRRRPRIEHEVENRGLGCAARHRLPRRRRVNRSRALSLADWKGEDCPLIPVAQKVPRPKASSDSAIATWPTPPAAAETGNLWKARHGRDRPVLPRAGNEDQGQRRGSRIERWRHLRSRAAHRRRGYSATIPHAPDAAGNAKDFIAHVESRSGANGLNDSGRRFEHGPESGLAARLRLSGDLESRG